MCLWKKEYWWKERQLWFTCGGSGVEGGHSCSTDAITTIYHCSIWVLRLFSFFIAVFAKLPGSTDYFLAFYKTWHILCRIRFVMQEITEPPMFRKLSHNRGKFLSLVFIYRGGWEGSREPTTDTWASFQKGVSLFLSQFCCLWVNIISSTTSWEWTPLKYNWKCIIKHKVQHKPMQYPQNKETDILILIHWLLFCASFNISFVGWIWSKTK